jgi:hypothetical protein
MLKGGGDVEKSIIKVPLFAIKQALNGSHS